MNKKFFIQFLRQHFGEERRGDNIVKKGFIFIFYFFAKTSRTSWVQDYPDPPNGEASEPAHRNLGSFRFGSLTNVTKVSDNILNGHFVHDVSLWEKRISFVQCPLVDAVIRWFGCYALFLWAKHVGHISPAAL